MAPAPTYPITGIQDGLPDVEIPGRIPLRVEVDDFYTLDEYAVQRNLFLLAMAKYEAMDPKEKLSYFQVAGTLKYAHCVVSQLKFAPRYPRFTPSNLGRPEPPRPCQEWRILPTQSHHLPDLASSLHASLRGEYISISYHYE